MDRRTAVKSAVGLAATTGLAGCSGLLGGGNSKPSGEQQATGNGDCSKPSANLEDALPDSDKYKQTFGPKEVDGDANKIEGTVGFIKSTFAYYRESENERLSFAVMEFESADAAEKTLQNILSKQWPGERAAGYVHVGNYLYNAAAPSKDEAKQFMATAEPLTTACVETNIEFR